MLQKTGTKLKIFLDSDVESQDRDWKVISNHYDNYTHLRVTACDISKVGVLARLETILKGDEDKIRQYDVKTIFIPGAKLQPMMNKEKKVYAYKIGNESNLSILN